MFQTRKKYLSRFFCIKMIIIIIKLIFSAWADDNMNTPPTKSQGRSVMTCDFVEPLGGVVKYNNKAWEVLKESDEVKRDIEKLGEERARRAGVILDASKEGYYTKEKAIPDFLKVRD